MADWKGIREVLLSARGLCSSQLAKTPLWSVDSSSSSPDSSAYFGYAGFGRMHCPLLGYENPSTGMEDIFTFTKFQTEADLNTFCEQGLNYREERANLLVRTYTEEPRQLLHLETKCFFVIEFNYFASIDAVAIRRECSRLRKSNSKNTTWGGHA